MFGVVPLVLTVPVCLFAGFRVFVVGVDANEPHRLQVAAQLGDMDLEGAGFEASLGR